MGRRRGGAAGGAAAPHGADAGGHGCPVLRIRIPRTLRTLHIIILHVEQNMFRPTYQNISIKF